MNNNNLARALQQGFYIAVGAVTDLVETVQNPEKRTEALSEWQMELNQKTREWSVKGETTEQEARRVLENFLRSRNWQEDRAYSDRTKESNESSNLADESDLNSGLQQLEAEIVALKTELAKIRESRE
jgi:polyhydroxyalkanoate synthesis regulator phasin